MLDVETVRERQSLLSVDLMVKLTPAFVCWRIMLAGNTGISPWCLRFININDLFRFIISNNHRGHVQEFVMV